MDATPPQGRRSSPGPGSRRPPAIALALALALIALGLLLLSGVIGGGDGVDADRIAELAREGGSDDPFAYTDERRADFERRAAAGHAHVLFAKSPGGIEASARRTARWRPEIERAAGAHGVDADAMEAIVLLESAGRPEVIAGDDPEVASGLAQIVASTGIDLLGMRVDLQRSRQLTKRIAATEAAIAKARQANSLPRLERREAALRERRRTVDQRFDPRLALDGMARYLEIAGERFGREDLAITSYHMGIGNLESVIERYTGSADSPTEELPYAQLVFDSSLRDHAAAWDLLASFGDDSSTYLWRVLAARRIMSLYRSDPGELRRLARLHAAKATQEEVFHPRAQTTVFDDPEQLLAAADDGDLVPLPEGDEYGYRLDAGLGELAERLEVDPELYRALRPEALATLVYMAARVRAINEGRGALTVTSAVRDQAYQDELVAVNPEASPSYSLHTTGYSFDIARDYASDRQAHAFQFMLDRLRTLNVIDYALEPRAVHITVSDAAQPLLDG